MLETHYLAGGNVENIVSALIASDKAKIQLPFEIATAIDLAGRDVKSAVETSVYPKVINAPVDGYLSAVAKDGIELKARARVTVRTNIPGLVGGATALIAIVAAAGMSLVTIAIGWVFYRPLVGIPLLILGIGGIVAIVMMNKKKEA